VLDLAHWKETMEGSPRLNRSSDSLDTVGKRKNFRRLFTRFAEKTSMVGVPYINNARYWWSKAIWSLLLIGAVTVMVLHLWYLFDQWYGWPKTTKVSLGFSMLPFPQVTICNVNPIHRGRLAEFPHAHQLKKLVHDMDPTNLIPPKGSPDPSDSPPSTSSSPPLVRTIISYVRRTFFLKMKIA